MKVLDWYSTRSWFLLLLQRGADLLKNKIIESSINYFTFHEDRLWHILADNVDQNICTLDDQKRSTG